MNAHLTKNQIARVLAEVAIPRHWHPVMVKRGSRQVPMIEIQDLEEVVSAVMFNVRQDLTNALAGIFRDECPDCARAWNGNDHSDCDL